MNPIIYQFGKNFTTLLSIKFPNYINSFFFRVPIDERHLMITYWQFYFFFFPRDSFQNVSCYWNTDVTSPCSTLLFVKLFLIFYDVAINHITISPKQTYIQRQFNFELVILKHHASHHILLKMNTVINVGKKFLARDSFLLCCIL